MRRAPSLCTDPGPLAAAIPLTALVATLLVVGCGGEHRPSPDGRSGTAPEPGGVVPETTATAEDVLLVTVDTLRADAVGFAGPGGARTPALDRLASRGRVFTDAHAPAVTTLPSHTSILTGLRPFEHGVRLNGRFVLDGEIPTLATVLGDAGFATGAFVGAFPLDSRFGLDRGFETYDDELPTRESEGVNLYPDRPGDEVVDRALDWWVENRDRRRFLWVHLFEPHAPYVPAPPFDADYAHRPYLGEVATADAFLAPLLEEVEREESVLVVLTSDHGESLGEHGEATHGLFAYEATLAVPLVVAGPGIEPGRDPRPARLVDLAPTVVAVTGTAWPGELPGRSLLDPPAPDLATSFEALNGTFDLGAAPLRGTIQGGMKLIVLPIPELYDLRRDPGETENLYRESTAEARRLLELIPRGSGWPPEAGEADGETRTVLRSLGYLGGSAPIRESYGPEDDPKRLVRLDALLQESHRLRAAGEPAAALDRVRIVLDERPELPLAHTLAADLLLDLGRTGEALALMTRARRRGIADRELLGQLALTLVRAGRPEEALEIASDLEGGPPDPSLAITRGLASTTLGRFDVARRAFDEALALSPGDPRAQEGLSFLEIARGEWEAARVAARRAVDADPDRPDAWNNLGIALYNLGRVEEAVAAWKRSVSLDPANPDTLFNLGLVAADAGDDETARTALERFLELVPPGIADADRNRARSVLDGLR